jgi:hypothetical protein
MMNQQGRFIKLIYSLISTFQQNQRFLATINNRHIFKILNGYGKHRQPDGSLVCLPHVENREKMVPKWYLSVATLC